MGILFCNSVHFNYAINNKALPKNISTTEVVKISKEILELQKLKLETFMDEIEISNGTIITATVYYPQDIDTILSDWKVDAKLISTQEMPAGTKVTIKYNGIEVAKDVDVSGKDEVYLSELIPGDNRPSIVAHAGRKDVWEVVINPGHIINTTITIQSVISKNDFVNEEVIVFDSIDYYWKYIMLKGVTTADARDDVPDENLTVTVNGDTLTITGSVNKSTAWFGPGTWNYYWVTLGIKIPEGITPILNQNGCYENLNVFVLKNRNGNIVWENSGTYEPVIEINGEKYMQFSFALDSPSTVLDSQGRMQIKVIMGGDYSYSGGEAVQIPENGFNIQGAQTLYVDYKNIQLQQ